MIKKKFKSRYSQPEMKSSDKIQRKKSLGVLRTHEKTKPKSPDATGKLNFQRQTLKEIYRQLDEAGGDEVVCNIAGWKNNDQYGQFLTIEVSPEFVAYKRRTPKPGIFDDVFNDNDDE
jgi:hypothetical protein